jgi:hypothetical protein
LTASRKQKTRAGVEKIISLVMTKAYVEAWKYFYHFSLLEPGQKAIINPMTTEMTITAK